MKKNYRKMVRDAAEILMAMCVDVFWRKNEDHSFRFASNAGWSHMDYVLNVAYVRPTHIRVEASDESFIHSYTIPMWMLSDSFFYQLWCTYKEEIKLTLTETGWKYFSEELEKRSAE